MKNIKFASTVQLLAILAILTGCQGNVSSQEQIYLGFEGIRIEFLRNTPPPRIFEESQFPVVLRVRNLGAYSIVKGTEKEKEKYALLSLGIEKDYNSFVGLEESKGRVEKTGIESQAKFNLEGRSITNQRGDEEIISYTLKTKKIEPQSERRTSPLLATLCYPYKSKVTATVCIDTDVSGIMQKPKACSTSDVTLDGGQGAPVAITRIETRMLPAGDKIKPQFIISVENRGGGEVIKDDSIDMMCSRDIDFPDIRNQAYNTISFKAYLSGIDEKNLLDCEPKLDEKDTMPYVKLFRRKDFVRCTVKEQNAIAKNIDAYTAPLNIEMDYGYTNTISANYIIEKLS